MAGKVTNSGAGGKLEAPEAECGKACNVKNTHKFVMIYNNYYCIAYSQQ